MLCSHALDFQAETAQLAVNTQTVHRNGRCPSERGTTGCRRPLGCSDDRVDQSITNARSSNDVRSKDTDQRQRGESNAQPSEPFDDSLPVTRGRGSICHGLPVTASWVIMSRANQSGTRNKRSGKRVPMLRVQAIPKTLLLRQSSCADQLSVFMKIPVTPAGNNGNCPTETAPGLARCCWPSPRGGRARSANAAPSRLFSNAPAELPTRPPC